ncbi:ribonuclease P protein component [Virgisporangium aliadipatigenens]|uniref:Ribonuclease P protein component n=1 Tax=Virgisporangium aliadipatigenens TaxID=741659 RepID=A0A8J3YN72_9ACTN|nr:ribonuclease P protein component [Virgisporangium aliadipatigenens]GIJ47148.1 ribonuclease P protein component [Virgisporangium aliadipatigenens]
MLAAAHRLRRRADFAATVRGGRRASKGALVVHMLVPGVRHPGDDSEPARPVEPTPPRAGFVVSRAVGGATVRNLVKRRLRHLMRERIAAFPSGTTLVVRALPLASSRTFPQMEKDLDEALARATAARRR